MKKILLMIMVMGLAGCSSNPTDFLGDYKIKYQSNRMIIIKYNSSYGSYETVYQFALEHCSQFGKTAVLNRSVIPHKKEVKTHMFYCVDKKQEV